MDNQKEYRINASSNQLSRIIDKSQKMIFAARETLYLFVLLKRGASNFDREKTYKTLLNKMDEFTETLIMNSFSESEINNAKYMLCAAMDEVILSYFTNAGASSITVTQTLMAHYYNDHLGGEKFFDILNDIDMTDKKNFLILSFSRYILSLGFFGKYLLMEKGTRDLLALRNKIFLSLSNLSQEISNLDQSKLSTSKIKINFSAIKNYYYACLFLCLCLVGFFSYNVFIQKNYINQLISS